MTTFDALFDAPVDGWATCDLIASDIFLQPALIDAGCRRTSIAAVESHDLSRSTHCIHACKTNIERLQQSM